MKIIALGHRKNVGKDELAKYLSTELKLRTAKKNIVISGFTDELKDTVYRLYSWAGVKRKEYYEVDFNRKNEPLPLLNGVMFEEDCTYRDILIAFGNHVRTFYEDTWMNALLSKTDIDILIIKDLRFQNEIDAVKKVGGICGRVDRDCIPKEDDAADGQLKDIPDSDWDFLVKNNGSRSDLHTETVKLINKFNLA